MLDPFEKDQQKIQLLFRAFYTVDCPAVAMQVEQIIWVDISQIKQFCFKLQLHSLLNI